LRDSRIPGLKYQSPTSQRRCADRACGNGPFTLSLPGISFKKGESSLYEHPMLEQSGDVITKKIQ
jgi:hypothetical protein